MLVKFVLNFVDIVKVRSSKNDGTATVRSPLQLFNIVKLLGSKTDGPATVRSPLQLFYTVKAFGDTRFEDRRPCYCTL